MKETPKAPASKPEPTPFDRMTDLTRRVVAVPKKEVERHERSQKRRRHSRGH